MEAFFNKISKVGECWLWTGAKRGKSGYGAMKYNGKVVATHRVSWMIHNGEIPDGLNVCHKCDVRLCVNPDHLFLGTQSDNMMDCSNKGRLYVNPNRPLFQVGHVPQNRALTKDVVQKIKAALQDKKGRTHIDIAKEFDVKYQVLRDIVRGRSYKNW